MARRPAAPRSAPPRPAAPRSSSPRPSRERPEPRESAPPAGPAPRRVVDATGRFGGLLRGRPWRRRRRAVIAAVLVVLLLAASATAALVWLPALRLQQTSVEGLGYVPESAVQETLEPHLGDSVLLLPAGTIAEDLEQVPGIEAAEVERRWPDGMHVSIAEEVPVAQLTRPDGTTAILDSDGGQLPAAAGEGASLVPMSIEAGTDDPAGATEAMSEVLAGLPDPLRGALTEITASSRSDVTLQLDLSDGGTKTVIWGDAADAELKAEVVQTLVSQPGSVIDVSSPVAPVTR